MRDPLLRFLMIILLAGQWACAVASKPSRPAGANVGTIGIFVPALPPEIKLPKLTLAEGQIQVAPGDNNEVSFGTRAYQGGIGILMGTYLGLRACTPCWFCAPFCAGIGALGVGLYGVLKEPPARDPGEPSTGAAFADSVGAIIKETFKSAGLHRHMANALLGIARRKTARSVVMAGDGEIVIPLAVSDPVCAPDSPVIDTALMLDVVVFGLEAESPSAPHLARPYARTSAALVRMADGQVLHRENFEDYGTARRFYRWATTEPWQKFFDEAAETLAELIVDKLVAPIPATASDR